MMALSCIEHFVLSHAMPTLSASLRKCFCRENIPKVTQRCSDILQLRRISQKHPHWTYLLGWVEELWKTSKLAGCFPNLETDLKMECLIILKSHEKATNLFLSLQLLERLNVPTHIPVFTGYWEICFAVIFIFIFSFFIFCWICSSVHLSQMNIVSMISVQRISWSKEALGRASLVFKLLTDFCDSVIQVSEEYSKAADADST